MDHGGGCVQPVSADAVVNGCKGGGPRLVERFEHDVLFPPGGWPPARNEPRGWFGVPLHNGGVLAQPGIGHY